MLQDFDASNVTPQQGISAHPPGMFDFAITHTYLKETKDKQGLLFVVEFTSPAGRIENRYNIYNNSPQAMEIAQKELSALCHAVGQFRVSYPKDAQGMPIFDKAGMELRGKRGRMEVAPQLNKDGTPNGYVEVKKVFDVNGNEPGKAPAQSQPGGQPMQQQPGGGWAQPQQQAPQQQPQGQWGGDPQPQPEQPQSQPQPQPQQWGGGQQPGQAQGGGEKPPWAR